MDGSAGSAALELPLKILAELPDGCAGLPLGLAGLTLPTLPAWGKVEAR